MPSFDQMLDNNKKQSKKDALGILTSLKDAVEKDGELTAESCIPYAIVKELTKESK